MTHLNHQQPQSRAKQVVNELTTRDKSTFNHAREITKSWGLLEPILEWCKMECQEEWRWQLIEMSTDTKPGRYIFYFDSERDFLGFVLKWQ